MQDETKADGRFKIADVDVNTLFDFGPAEQNRAAFYMYNGGIETRKDLGTEVYMDDYINKREE